MTIMATGIPIAAPSDTMVKNRTTLETVDTSHTSTSMPTRSGTRKPTVAVYPTSTMASILPTNSENQRNFKATPRSLLVGGFFCGIG